MGDVERAREGLEAAGPDQAGVGMTVSVTLDAIDKTILHRLDARPSWSRSLQVVKPRVDRLIKLGLVERFCPPTGTAKNMVRLTPQGQDVFDGLAA